MTARPGPAPAPAGVSAERDRAELLALRAEFPILQRSAYLISHSLGAMPRGVYDRLKEYADLWASRGIRAWAEGWWTSPIETGDLVGRIIGAPPGSVVMHQNVSVIEGLVASCLEFLPPRNRVVYSELNFPSVMYVWEAQRRRGAEIVTVPSRDGVTIDTEDMLAAIDERTLIVPLSHVLFQSACIQDLEAIQRRAREVGALVLADCYQSAGTVPFDVTRLGLDMACGGSVKWLCGGPGAGWLYVRPDLRERLQPALTGWMAHEHPFAFEKGPQKYAHDATRLLHGSPAVPALYAARSGYELVLKAGPERIRAKSVAQTTRFLERAAERGLKSKSPADPARRGGTVTLDVPHAPALVAALAAREILVDSRPDVGLRLSPHFYNTDDELDACLDAVGELLRDGGWKPFATQERAY
ncbi:MAG TPA: aminotransferase class V-fold PLP-dependent enzyme [Planctomycetota bacterium]|nr:aminotransferase class V-fold PLP-dependent enzyme [Planctomycetota bacterium]